MPDERVYSTGIDLRGIDLAGAVGRAALARLESGSESVEVLPASDDAVAAVEHRIEREGRPPAAVVLAAPLEEPAPGDDVAGDLARRLRLPTHLVRIIDRAEAEAIGVAFLNATGREAEDAESAAAIGAALSGVREARRAAGLLAAGGAGAVAGGLGAAALTGEATTGTAAALGPAGVPLAPGAAAAAGGVPFTGGFAGPVGVPLAEGAAVGPTGVPVGSGPAVGPAGAPLDPGAGIGPTGAPIAEPVTEAVPMARRRRVALIAAAVVVVLVVAVAVVAASGDDSPATTATTAPFVASELASVAPTVATTAPTAATEPVASTTEPSAATVASTSPPTTAPAELVGAKCAVGSWLADNEVMGAVFANLVASGGGAVELGEVTGSVRLDVSADGTITTTFDDFVLTAEIAGVGTAEVRETGVETATAVFRDDGSFTATPVETNTVQSTSFGGAVVFEGPSPEPVFEGDSTFTCAGDQLVFTRPGELGDLTEVFNRDG